MTVTISKTLLKKECLMGCHIAASVVRSSQLTSTVQRGQCSLDGKLSPSRGLYGLGYRSIVSSLRIQSLRQAIATTFDTYSHVPPGMQDEAALRFDQGIAKAQNERPQDCSWGLLSYLNFGSGGWIRTNDLRVMRLMPGVLFYTTRYNIRTQRSLSLSGFVSGVSFCPNLYQPMR